MALSYCIFAWGIGVGVAITHFYKDGIRPSFGDFIAWLFFPILFPIILPIAEYFRRNPGL